MLGAGEKPITEGSDKLFEKIFGEAAPDGMGAMIYAHLRAPREAYLGKGKEAVNTAVSGFGAIAAAPLAAAFGPAGMAVGFVITKGPGTVIEFMDTSSTRQTVMFTNLSKYHIEIEGIDGHSYYNNDQMCLPVFDTEKGGVNVLYNTKGYVIPSVHIRADSSSDEAHAGVWSFPLKQSKD